MTQDITLRAPEPDDIGLIYLWENEPDERHTSLRTGLVSRRQIEEYVLSYDGDIFNMGGLRFMIQYGDDTVGTVDVFDFDRRCRHAFVAIYVASGNRRRGIATQALRQVAEYVRHNLSMHSLAAMVAADNIPSQKLFEHAGYMLCGQLAGWINDGQRRIDANLYQIVLG